MGQPDFQLNAQDQEACLAHLGHALMDNRHGLAMDGCATQAAGTAEHAAFEEMADRVKCRRRNQLGRRQGLRHLDLCRTAHPYQGHPISPRSPRTDDLRYAPSLLFPDRRLRQEPQRVASYRRHLCWLKRIGGMKKLKLLGTAKAHSLFTVVLAAYSLVRGVR